MHRLILATVFLFAASAAQAQVTEFNFRGNGGFGLLPGNEVGDNTSLGSDSTAVGGEVGGGISFDASTNILNIEFDFEGLDGGLLFAAGSGIHLHLPADVDGSFDQTGPIVFNLNSFDDANVTNSNTQIADGATSGSVSATVQFSPEQVDDLFAGGYYLNIHSQTFSGGELRGNLVAVPEPTAALLSLTGLVGFAARRRR